MALFEGEPPQLTGCGAETLPIDLGTAVAFLGREPKGGNDFLRRVRWLAENREETFTPDAVLGGRRGVLGERRGPAFAEEALAEALIGEFAAACPTADPSAGAASQASGSPAI